MTVHKKIIRIAFVTALLLLVPLVAMQITNEVAWGPLDFAVAGALLFGSGLTYELVARKAGHTAYRAAVGIAVATALILVWVNLAVGLIGAEGNPANLLYGGVLAIGIIGAAIANFRSRGMTYALLAMAGAQALVPVIALFIWKPQTPFWGAAGMLGVMTVNGVFVLLFVLSALLFERAASAPPARRETDG